MPRYLVSWREIHVAQSLIEADSAEEAIRIAKSDDPDDIDTVAVHYENEWVADIEDSYTSEEYVTRTL